MNLWITILIIILKKSKSNEQKILSYILLREKNILQQNVR